MNQILMVENKKKKKNKSNSRQIEIKNIVRFFAFCLMVFGIFFIGQGSYAMYNDYKGKNTENMPIVSISRVNDNVIVKVNSKNTITNFKYSWSNSEETVREIDSYTMEEEIVLPNENSILKIVIEEDVGRAITYFQEIVVEGIDILKPQVDITEEANVGSIKISATDETEISYITYKVNNEDEIKIDRAETEKTRIDYILKLERGESKIYISAVDSSGNIKNIEKTVIVSERPTMELQTNEDNLIITIRDTDGVREIEINLNGTVYAGKDLNQKEIKVPLKLNEGTNSIKVKVTNVNGLVVEGVKELNYTK